MYNSRPSAALITVPGERSFRMKPSPSFTTVDVARDGLMIAKAPLQQYRRSCINKSNVEQRQPPTDVSMTPGPSVSRLAAKFRKEIRTKYARVRL